ncbi:MAG: phosphoenolpyruvate carboxykinase (ATP), partial [Aestuariivirgaceae bacterium]
MRSGRCCLGGFDCIASGKQTGKTHVTQTDKADRTSNIAASGLTGLAKVHYNLSADELYDLSVERGEATALASGPLAVTTGKHTGRSALDKFIVRDALTENSVWWDNNAEMKPEHFDELYKDIKAHAKGMTLFVQDLYGGADPANRIKVRVVTQFAWHALFIRYLLRRPEAAELEGFGPDLTIIDLPSFKADPARHGTRTET